MVGKVKRVRQKLHHAAVRPGSPEVENETPATAYPAHSAQELAELPTCSKPLEGKDWNLFSTDIFATTKIDLQHVTKTLDVDRQSVVTVKKEKKPLVPKKEKAKQRRERWLQKIETITSTRQKLKAQEKRKAIPVVGDMQPLVDALPELSELTTVRKPRAPRNQPRGVVKKKEPTNYSKMKPAQKRKMIEEEVSRMQELIKNPSFKANPLAAVGQHLLKRVRQEQEENLS